MSHYAPSCLLFNSALAAIGRTWGVVLSFLSSFTSMALQNGWGGWEGRVEEGGLRYMTSNLSSHYIELAPS